MGDRSVEWRVTLIAAAGLCRALGGETRYSAQAAVSLPHATNHTVSALCYYYILYTLWNTFTDHTL